MRHKEGIDRNQVSFEPLCFDGLISEGNPVRAIDVIAKRFDMIGLGFAHGKTKETGRKPYNPRIAISRFITSLPPRRKVSCRVQYSAYSASYTTLCAAFGW